MSSIVFVSTFPTEANMRDGYFRRVHYVDQAFHNSPRIHLDIRFGKNFRKKTVAHDDNMKVMHLNAVLHFFLIGSVLRKSGIIYVHSIAKIPSILLHLILIRNRVPFALDLHGVMVEELKLSRKRIKAFLYTWIESYCFKKSSLNVYVSEVMQNHFRKKYPFCTGESLVFATNSNPQPETSNPQPATCNPQPATGNLQPFSLLPGEVLMIYSGNCQPWQNIGLMLDTMNKLTDPRIKFLILSGQKKRFENLIRRKRVPEGKITVLSVRPEELDYYYELAHYGFILRDDILVNRVANPTKLAEYLQFGIIPVVKLVDIGDYARYSYEFLPFGDLTNGIPPAKSGKNRNIYLEICRKYGSAPLQKAVKKIQNRYIKPSMP